MGSDQTKVLSLRAAYAFGEEHGLNEKINEIRNMVVEWDRPQTSSLRRGFIVELFQDHGIFEEFRKKHWSFGSTSAGEGKLRFYRRIRGDYSAYLSGSSESEDSINEDSIDDSTNSAFALESHLRDFLIKNLTSIEEGLKLFRDGERLGSEYVVDDGNGRIDILAVDSKNNYVVIELKVGQGRNKVVGQLLYYMGWVDKYLIKDQQKDCRGIIIASEVSEDLKLAVKRVPGVSVFSYNLTFKLEKASQ
jgi:hypothetical protein